MSAFERARADLAEQAEFRASHYQAHEQDDLAAAYLAEAYARLAQLIAALEPKEADRG